MSGKRNAPAPAAPPDTAIYAIGDIHGETGKLDALHRMILVDAETRGARRRRAIYLGDYIDRGPDSAGILDRLGGDPLPGFEYAFLKGNHEELMIRFLNGLGSGTTWLANGGIETLASYGLDLTGAVLGEDTRREFARRVPAAHRRFLDALVPYRIEGDYLFVHAGIRPGRKLEAQVELDMLWIRDVFLNSRADHGHVVVHGHTPTSEPDERPNRIGIDTGACYGGKLTAVVLEGTAREFLQA